MFPGLGRVSARVSMLVAVLAAVLVYQASGFGLTPTAAEQEYTYYGHIPAEIWAIEAAKIAGQDIIEYRINPTSIMTRGLVVVIGNHDGTSVGTYTLPQRALVKEFTVNRIEKVVVPLPNGTFFKVVSDKPVTVLLLGGLAMESGEAFAYTFFTSTTGGYVGKEFIFEALQSKFYPENYAGGPAYKVYALEDSDVTITDENGSKVSEFKLGANGFREFSFKPLAAFRLVSSGYVMVQSFFLGSGFDPVGTCFYPSVRGGFVGTTFYGAAFKPGAWAFYFTPPEFIVTGVEDSKITVVDTEYKRKDADITLSGASNLSAKINVGHMVLESERPVMLMLRNNGLAYTGLKAGQTAYIYVPTGGTFAGEAYVFAYKETTVTIDDVSVKLPADGFTPLYQGLHKLSANENIVIQVANWPAESSVHYTYIGRPPSFMRLSSFGACLPSAQSMSISYEDLRLKPVLGGETPWIYIAVAVAAAVVVAIAAALRRRKR